ncbi:hypothetical protein AAFF_G00265900 [Aldrovandia affinis]|uniref:Uncharacterized protein n=1 Tax=Aldrovandia affinis TaxID=143900 RepID=A0AAD7RE40_9TELE|nr:hypothetical protein AAFF_G00265900 [Aldrovandia affinis]
MEALCGLGFPDWETGSGRGRDFPYILRFPSTLAAVGRSPAPTACTLRESACIDFTFTSATDQLWKMHLHLQHLAPHSAHPPDEPAATKLALAFPRHSHGLSRKSC